MLCLTTSICGLLKRDTLLQDTQTSMQAKTVSLADQERDVLYSGYIAQMFRHT